MSIHEFTHETNPGIDATAAKAANLRERALAVEAAGPAHEDTILRSFVNPTWQELQRSENYQIGLVADAAANAMFGVNGKDGLTPRIADYLEQGATYLVRRVHPEFVQAAQDQAVEALLLSDEFRAMAAGRPRNTGELRLLAHRLVMTMRAAYHGVMEATTPVKPALYLRCAAAATERGAR